MQEQFAKSRSHISEWIKQIEYLKQKYADAKVLFRGHGQYDAARTLLDEQLNYLITFKSLVNQQMQQSAAKMGGERTTANITEGGVKY